MNKIEKALARLPLKQRIQLLEAYARIVAGKPEGLGIKKLKDHADLYRLRVAGNRLVYRLHGHGSTIVHVGKRDGQTYRDF